MGFCRNHMSRTRPYVSNYKFLVLVVVALHPLTCVQCSFHSAVCLRETAFCMDMQDLLLGRPVFCVRHISHLRPGPFFRFDVYPKALIEWVQVSCTNTGASHDAYRDPAAFLLEKLFCSKCT